jgi:hypothetical protein
MKVSLCKYHYPYQARLINCSDFSKLWLVYLSAQQRLVTENTKYKRGSS